MMIETAYDYIKRLTIQLYETYDDWEPLQTRADERVYDLLGRIYEEAATIDADRDKRFALVVTVRKHREIKESKKWSANSKSSAELLVTLLLGLKEKRSRKHNWLGVLAYAEEQEVPSNAEAFKAWISSSRVGGIEGAIDLYKGGTGETNQVPLKDVVAKLEDKAEGAETVDVVLTDHGPEGLAVLIVRKVSDTQVKVLSKSVEESKVKRVLADLGISKRPKKRTPTQLASIETAALRSLNRVTQKIADGRKLGGKDALVFMGAVERLNSVPELAEKHFAESPWVNPKFGDKSQKEADTIPVANTNFHAFDPGRYIRGAREASLIPYAFDPDDMAKTRLAAIDFLTPPAPPEQEKYESNPMASLDEFAIEEAAENA